MPDTSEVLIRFNRLMRDVECGEPSRNSFLPWEVELLLDLDNVRLESSVRSKVMDRYCRAVRRGLERGAKAPIKLSEYIARLQAKRRECPMAPSRPPNPMKDSTVGDDPTRAATGRERSPEPSDNLYLSGEPTADRPHGRSACATLRPGR